MNKKRYITLVIVSLLLLHFSIRTNAQDTILPKTDDSQIQQQLENIAESTENEDADYTNLLEDLVYYKEHPINLNKTNREELKQLGLLSDIEINNLLNHIKKNGKLITIYELQGVQGFDIQTIEKILPYVKVNDNFTSAHFGAKEMFKDGQHAVMFRYSRILEKQTGFTGIDSAALFNSKNSRYIGSPDKLYLRYRFTYGTNVSWGFTAEKDQGELFFKNKQRFKYDWYEQGLNGKQKNGFDFYSGHIFIKNIRFVKALAIGDYQATFGQGLTMWSGLAFGKSSLIMNVKKSANGIRAYTSVNENLFLRGAAATIKLLKKIEVTGFYSQKNIDANVTDTTESGDAAVISSLQETGYHTTLGEIQDKNVAKQTIFGGNISYKGDRFNIGITGMNYSINTDLKRDLSFYNKFEFSARQTSTVGIDYNFLIKNFNFFGEAAMSQNGGKGMINGVLISLDPRLALTILHRYFEKDFQNPMSNVFAESSIPANEKGLYLGLTAKPLNTITLTAYYDRFEFPWLKYQIDAPSYGNDYVVQLNYTPSKKVDFYFRIRERNKFKNNPTIDAADLNYIVPVNQRNYRFNISYTILPSLKLRNRIELIDYKTDKDKTQKGYIVYQDIVFNKIGKPLSVTLRYALFQTDSYDSRLYMYENDVLGAYSIPSFYNKGSRFYVMLNYNLTRRIELWFRYSQTVYQNQHVISEGSLTEIQGNTRSEIKAQVRFKF